MMQFPIPKVNKIQFHGEMKKMPDFIILEDGLYGDGLHRFMVREERDNAGYVAYYIPGPMAEVIMREGGHLGS